MKEIKVSVIIPVYNSEKFLNDCLTTILAQTLKEIEIICVNDGSTDESLKILNEFSKTDSRITVIDQKNQGAGAARNAGLAVAKGEYLSFLDADDFYENNMLERSYEVAKKADADVCVFYADLFDNSTKQYKPCTWAFRTQYFEDQTVFNPAEYPNNENIFRMFNGWPWDKLFKREFIQNNNLFYQCLRTTNDMYFVFIALAKAKRIITLNECLIHQRVDVKTSLSRTREESWDCFYLGLKAMYEELVECNLYNTYKKAFLNWTVNFSLWQLNSMKGTAYGKVYNLLRNTAFEELKVTEFPEDDFYNLSEYQQFKNIMEKPLETNLMEQIEKLEKDKQSLYVQTEKLKVTKTSKQIKKSQPTGKKLYLDILNIIACFSVVVLHCTSKAWNVDGSHSWYISIILQGTFIWAVTIFFMLTGAKNLIYREKYSTSVFLKKQLGKIVLPLLLFSAFYAIFFQITQRVHYDSLTEMIKAIINNDVVTIFWFFDRLIPLYICIPIISLLNKKMKVYFVILSLIINFILPLLNSWTGLNLNQYTLNLCNIIVAIALIGNLLDTIELKKKIRIIIYMLGIICTIFSIAITINISLKANEYLKTYLTSTSLTTIIQASALWVLIKYLFEKHIKIKKSAESRISTISSCCFGIYLLQMIPLELVRLNGKINVYSPYYSLLGSIAIFSLCLTISYLYKKIIKILSAR